MPLILGSLKRFFKVGLGGDTYNSNTQKAKGREL
jgi:hypothetical protein